MRPPLPLIFRALPVALALPLGAKPALDVHPTATPPAIDGRLDDAAWREAAPITDFRQVSPQENVAPSERTEVRITFDADRLYVAFRCFDSEPDKIIAKEMQHDRDTGSDDLVRFAIDTFHRQSDGYFFALTAGGSKHEGIIQNKESIVMEWDAIWEGRTARDATGWTAEFAIPMKSLAFDPAGSVWGFDCERIVRRKQERMRWSGLSRTKGVATLPELGELRGLTGLRQGRGLELRPFASLSYAPLHDRAGEPVWKLKPGFDFTWHMTPSLAATLTVNTDFAETEVDDRQVNLSRFSLFFPEKRDFFLQDAALFSFADIDSSPYPYFSRRIGLAPDGTPVDILAGLKIAGRLGRVSVGVLDTQIDATDTVRSKNLLVARTAVQLSPAMSAGLLLTNGDPRIDGHNTVGGVDFNYVNTHVAGSKTVHVHTWLVGTDSALAGGRDHAEAVQFRYPNEPWNIYAYAGRYGAKYDPALGFVPRAGIGEFTLSPAYVWRSKSAWVQQIWSIYRFSGVTDLHGHLLDSTLNLPLIELDSPTGGYFVLEEQRTRETVTEPFALLGGVTIPARVYHGNYHSLSFGTSRSRAVSGRFQVSELDFYTGTRRDYEPSMEWRASRYFFASVGWNLRRITLPQGRYDVHVANARINVSFSPDLSLNTVAQYDNQSKQLGLNARLKWIVQPGNEVFLVWNQNYDADSDHLHARAAKIATKAAWTIRW
jgi:hypothetical protein